MDEKIIKFVQKVNEIVPELSVEGLLAVWEEIEKAEEEDMEKVEEKTVEASTCKHMYLKGRNAKTRCMIRVKGTGEYYSKHKNASHK